MTGTKYLMGDYGKIVLPPNKIFINLDHLYGTPKLEKIVFQFDDEEDIVFSRQELIDLLKGFKKGKK